MINHRWFKVSLNAQAIVQDVVATLIQFGAAYGLHYYFGSMHLQMNEGQFQEFKAKLGPLGFELALSPPPAAGSHLITEDKWDYEPWVYQEAIAKNQADADSDEEFYNAFVKVFLLDKRGALRVTKEEHRAIMLFTIRFAHKIKGNSGMQAIVPRFSKDPNANKVEMFRLFVSVYPAYCGMCERQKWENNFYWSYNVDAE